MLCLCAVGAYGTESDAPWNVALFFVRGYLRYAARAPVYCLRQYAGRFLMTYTMMPIKIRTAKAETAEASNPKSPPVTNGDCDSNTYVKTEMFVGTMPI